MRIKRPIRTDDILIDWRSVGSFMTNSFLLACPKTKEGAIIDASAEPSVLLDMIKKHDIKLKYILQTHAHLDHVGAIHELKKQTGAEILIHKEELYLYDTVAEQCAMFGLKPLPTPPAPDKMLTEGEEIILGDLKISVMETPGHTLGGLCFYLDSGYIFTGDTLFAGSIGRTDLPGGNYKTLMKSLKRLASLPEKTFVFSGHGEISTIGNEKIYNPYL